ncbi:MAG: sterol desaturase family protein [Gammaproteobacteria bacterium]
MIEGLSGVYKGKFPRTAAIVGLLCADFFFYWGHRFAHEGVKKPHLGWLWKLHRTHNAGKFMNITLTARINPVWYFVVPTAWVYSVGIYHGLGMSVRYALAVAFGWNLFTHTHFRWDDFLPPQAAGQHCATRTRGLRGPRPGRGRLRRPLLIQLAASASVIGFLARRRPARGHRDPRRLA